MTLTRTGGEPGPYVLSTAIPAGSGGDTNAANNTDSVTLTKEPDKYIVIANATVLYPTSPGIAFTVSNASEWSTWSITPSSLTASITLGTPTTSYPPGGAAAGQDGGMGSTMVTVFGEADSGTTVNFVQTGDITNLAPGAVFVDPGTDGGYIVDFIFNGAYAPGTYSATITINYTLVGDATPRTDSTVLTWTVEAP